MNEIQIFNNAEFGEIRTFMIDGKTYFVANDIAKALGYAKPQNAVSTHCRYALKQGVPHPQNPDRIIEVIVIPEGDMYRLISKSKLKSAEKFEKWVFDEVLPTIRKTGGYQIPQTTDGKIALLAQGHVELKQEVDSIKADLESLKMDLPILPIEADIITEAVRKKGVELMGGKESNAYKDGHLRSRVYTAIYSDLKRNFGVRSYKSLKRHQCDRAVIVISNFMPTMELEDTIKNTNAQQTFL